MSIKADLILEQILAVERLRRQRLADLALAERVLAVKSYQARRFERTYSDMLCDPRYQRAARFFLEELYGPREFADRDAQFARVVPAIVRIFPDEVVRTVEALSELHFLSETLDTTMATHVPARPLQAQDYLKAWRATAEPTLRARQIDLTLEIGHALDRHTRSRLIRGTLRVMRRPAQAAGLSALQRFLESGFEAFGAMRGAEEFLRLIGERERALASALFNEEIASATAADLATPTSSRRIALAQLP